MDTSGKRGKFYGEWCLYFLALLDERGLGVTDFARMCGSDRASAVQAYVQGIARPPLAKIDAWSKLLELTASEHERFKRLALLAHAPPEVRVELERLRQRIERLEQRLENKRA